MTLQNQQIVLASRPGSKGPEASNFTSVQSPMPAIEQGQVLLQTHYLSLDPYMRARMYEGDNYAGNVALGDPMVGQTVSRVIESQNPDFETDDWVLSAHGWQKYFISDGAALRKIDPDIAPVTTALGVLGLPGHTGYGGLLRYGQPQRGETVLVSAASGAVGSVVAQVARLKGCRVVGIAGGAKKCAYIKDEFGVDAAVDHRSATLAQDLKQACPDGIDIYFDNVGGPIFPATMPLFNNQARIVVCGTIAVDRNQAPQVGVDHLQELMSLVLIKQLTVRGFIFPNVLDMVDDFRSDVSGWIKSGDLRYREHIIDGLDNAPQAFLGLFTGANFGKLLVRV
ncbi:MAG: NADP-dependent oxidoreductase [Rhodobacteraceae bacterium]|nr:MAG: NADP-dependent oxidoreductase [Paracoccaceae bacterium]